MSITLMSKVWKLNFGEGETGRSRKLVMMALADHANDDGLCWPSADYVAWKTEYSERQIQRLLDTLEAEGVIEVYQEHTPTTPRVYRLTLDNVPAKEPYKRKPSGRGDIFKRQGVTFRDEGVTFQEARGDTMVSPEPPLEPSLESSVQPPAAEKTYPQPVDKSVESNPESSASSAQDYRDRILKAAAEFEDSKGRNANIADAKLEREEFVEQVVPIIAEVMGYAVPTKDCWSVARKIEARGFKKANGEVATRADVIARISWVAKDGEFRRKSKASPYYLERWLENDFALMPDGKDDDAVMVFSG